MRSALASRTNRAPRMASVRAVPPQDHSPECGCGDVHDPSEHARVAILRSNRDETGTRLAIEGSREHDASVTMEVKTSAAGEVTRSVFAPRGGLAAYADRSCFGRGPHHTAGTRFARRGVMPRRVLGANRSLVLWARATSHGWHSLRSAGRELDRMDLMDRMDFRTTKRCTCCGRRSHGQSLWTAIVARGAKRSRLGDGRIASEPGVGAEHQRGNE